MILYLYPEEWTGSRARETHTLSTCVALAQNGTPVTLVTAGGGIKLERHLQEMTGEKSISGLGLVALSRSLGPLRSAGIFRWHFYRWLSAQKGFRLAYIIHLKAAEMVRAKNIPYAYEAHEIFSETPQNSPRRDRTLFALEKDVVTQARWRIATSHALAAALVTHYQTPDDFIIAPNAGGAPLEKNLGAAEGPFLYFGSIANWKGLHLVIAAAETAQAPLRIVGGTEEQWERLQEKTAPHPDLVSWRPRVPLRDLADALAGARAGIIPTQPETGSGRYSCPMKLFDYARAGLPVLTTALPSLASLTSGDWCTRVPEATADAWARTFRDFRYDPAQADAARVWAAGQTWAKRAETLRKALLP